MDTPEVIQVHIVATDTNQKQLIKDTITTNAVTVIATVGAGLLTTYLSARLKAKMERANAETKETPTNPED